MLDYVELAFDAATLLRYYCLDCYFVDLFVERFHFQCWAACHSLEKLIIEVRMLNEFIIVMIHARPMLTCCCDEFITEDD